MKTTNGSRRSASNSLSVANSLSISTVNVSDASLIEDAVAAAAAGACWPATKSMHQHGAVVLERRRIVGGEVQGHERRVRPVEQPRRQSSMLTERQPVPDRVLPSRPRRVRTCGSSAAARARGGRHVGPPRREAHERAGECVAGARGAAKRIRRAEPLQIRVPRPRRRDNSSTITPSRVRQGELRGRLTGDRTGGAATTAASRTPPSGGRRLAPRAACALDEPAHEILSQVVVDHVAAVLVEEAHALRGAVLRHQRVALEPRRGRGARRSRR